jgi:hypothetical protein
VTSDKQEKVLGLSLITHRSGLITDFLPARHLPLVTRHYSYAVVAGEKK